MVPKNKPCKRNNRQISDNTKIAAKQGNAEERPDAGCEIKRWKAAAEMSSVFNIPPDISKADKPQGFGDRVPDSPPPQPLGCKSVLKVYRKLRIRQTPVSDRHGPLLGYLFDAHIDDLAYGIIGRKNRL